MPTPRGFRLRISLRGLLALAMVVGVLLGWKVRHVARQKRAVAMVKASYGSVEYDYERNPKCAGNVPGPDWLCELVGLDYFAAVVRVALYQPVADIESLAGLPELESLMVECEQGGLRTVGSRRNLRVLVLSNSDVTDLSPLRKLGRLEDLYLIDARVADEEVCQLQRALPYCKVHRRDTSTTLERFTPLDQMDEAEVRAIYNRWRSVLDKAQGSNPSYG